MAYEAHSWSTGEPITQQKMMNIENGIAAAHQNASTAQSTADGAVSVNQTQTTAINGLQTNVDNINKALGKNNGQNVFNENNTVANAISSISGQITLMNQESEQGAVAWDELSRDDPIKGKMVEYVTTADGITVTTHLRDFLDSAYYTNTAAQTAYQTPNPNDEIAGPNNTKLKVGSLAQRIQHIYNKIDATAADLTVVDNGLDSRLDDVEIKANVAYDSIGGTTGQTVAARLSALDGGDGVLPDRTVKSLINELQAAHFSTALGSDGNEREFEYVDSTQAGGLDARFENIETELVGAHTNSGTTLNIRFNNIDGGNKPSRTLPEVISEIADAHRNNLGNDEITGEPIVDTLDKRFDDIDARIGLIDNTQNENSLIQRVDSLERNYVDKSNIENGLTYELQGKVLDARQGKILNDRITTVDNALDARLDSIEAARLSHIDELSGETIYDTLDDRFDAIDGGATPSRTLPNLIKEVEDAYSSDVKGTIENNELVPHVYTSLDARLEAIETDIDTIARDLDMYDSTTGEISDLHTRVDTIAANLIQMANEIGMIQDGAAVQDLQTAWTDTSTRLDDVITEIGNAHRTLSEGTDTLVNRFEDIESNITDLSNAIDHVHGENDELPDGLDQRITSVESVLPGITNRLTAIDDASTGAIKGLQDVDLELDGRLDAIDGGATLDITHGTLAARVSSLESEPKSATVIIDEVTYSEETGDPTNISNPSTDVDYLLKKDNKYYYWKYIKTSSNPDTYVWALISGGSGSGTGNTSGMDLTSEEYETIKTNNTYAINTDYYVLETDGVRHHYRYITVTENNEQVLREIEIGKVIDTDQIKKYNISRVTGKKREYNSQTQTWTETDEDVEYLNLYQYNYDESNATIDTDRPYFAQIELPKGGDGGTSSSQKNVLTRIGSEVIQKVTGSQIVLRVFFSSYDSTGTESSVGYATLRAGNSVIFSNRELSSYESATVPSPLTWQEETAGFHEFDVTDYCGAGNTIFTLSVDVGGSAPLGKTWRVNLTELRLESNAPDNLLISIDDTYDFPYTPIGAVNKTLTVTIDKGTENEQERNISIANTISGSATTYTLDPEDLILPHGKHTIEMQLFASIGGVTEPSNKINREYIWYDVNDINTPIIIASQYEGATITETQYSTIEIPYQVYKKNANIIEVEYYLDEEAEPYQTSTLTNTNVGTLAYIATTAGAHKLKIKVDDVYIVINLNITVSKKNLSPISGMVIDFDPTTLSNGAANRLPVWNTKINGVNQTFRLTASPNFNWSDDINGGGYKKDANGDRCFVIKAGSYVDLDYPMFANDVLGNGAEMKIIFKTSAVRNAEAVWYKNTGEISGKTVGIQLGTHYGWLKTDKATASSTSADEDEDENTITIKGITYTYWQPNTVYNPNDVRIIQKTIYRCTKATTAVDYDLENADLDEDPYKTYMKNWTKVGQLDTEVIATNTYLYFPYSEEDKIELDININKKDTGNDFIMSYEDGVPSKAYAYTTGAGGDKIAHNNTIHIGSDECDVYIYHLRYYVKALSTDQILQNFIADGKDLSEKVERYDRNCIYWNPELNEGEGGYVLTKTSQSKLDPIKLAAKMPDVKVLMLDTDVFTTSKKDFVMNSTLRCIHAEGGNVYKSRGDEDNWLFINGFHAGQGTTSDNYGQSARNVDFLFEVDAEHWPSKEKNMGKYKISENPNYISMVIKGAEASEFTNKSWGTSYSEWAENTAYLIGDKVSITNGNNGIIYVCIKAHTSGETFESKNWNKIGTTSKCSDWMEDNCKITLTESSVPNNYFNFKANVASSENVNNALFQKRYDDFLTYKSPAQAAQVAKHHDTYENISKVQVKNCMEFVPAVLFVREHAVNAQTGLPEGHVEFNDCEWHFYALGNIGDSKKSDYTRAYDPDDMNEFTCENSDNNTNNGQFQSGVFTYQGHTNAIETDYQAWNETIAYATDAIVVYDGMVYTRTGETQTALGEGETYTWIAADWTAITYTGWTDSEAPYFAPRTNPNPMDYTYPITPSQWNVKFGDNYLNRKHMTLVKEKFDGDHSFEFRYACCGDYRDGDLINDTHEGADTEQFNLNHDVMLAMYEWLITSTPEQYVNEAPQWFVKNAMEFFYAYTHYYTMMDNRAKNTFWHFAKTGQHRRVSRPVPELFHIYEVADGTVTTNTEGICTGTFIPATGTFNASGEYYTQYAFDLWVYDCDTAAGIDNNGALVFPYGKEDDDYRGDDASTGYAFNGAGSIFWRRLKTTFADEIATVMTKAGKNCFDPEHLINEFDNFQSCFPEEIWRLDIERKYIRTYTGESIDGSITTNKQNARFLMSMMQGRKKYQRRQWIRDQSFYFNSKYKIGEIDVNKTEFNIVSPAGDHSLLAVPPDYHLYLTPYQDMYLNVVVGNGSPIPQIRAKANTEYTIKLDDYTAGNFAETRVYISGFKMISKLGGLASMYPYAFTLNGLDHLKELDIGTDVAGYSNGNFTELPLTDKVQLPLLEKLNIKNCSSLSTSIGLKTANNLRVVEAAGSNIGGISLPDYTQIRTLHLPVTVTDLILHHARFLRDFSITDVTGAENYNNLYTLNIENSDYSGNYIWEENTEYEKGELIVIGNNVYKCKEDHTSVAASTQENTEAWNSYLTSKWTLVKENSKLPIDWIYIATKMLQKESLETNLALIDLSTATITNVQSLAIFKTLKETIDTAGGQIELSGTIHVTGNWSKIEAQQYTNNIGYYNNNTWVSSLTQQEINNNPNPAWPNLILVIDPAKEQFKCLINYYESGYYRNGIYIEPVFIDQVFVAKDGTEKIEDIYVGKSGSQLPHRDPTIASVFSFGSYDEESQYIEYSGWTTNADSTDPNIHPLTSEGYSRNNPFTPNGTQNEINLYTFYNTTNHEYTVQWKLNGVIVKQVTEQYYGGGYSLEAPTAAQLRQAGYQLATVDYNGNNNTYTYTIFDGWEKLPINISPSESEAVNSIYVINAKWKTVENKALYDANDSTSIFYNINNQTLSAEQLLIFSHLGSNTIDNHPVLSQIKPTYKLPYTMGYDGAISGTARVGNLDITSTELINSNNVKRIYSTTIPTEPGAVNDNSIKVYPFRLNEGFTIAIDYQFGASNQSTLPEVLVGCYDKTQSGSITGFALYRGYNTNQGGSGTFVCYGISPNNIDTTKRKAVGDATHRNIIVLRHPANSSDLYVYTSLNSNASSNLNTTIDTSATERRISLSAQNLSQDAQICIGHLRADISTNSDFLSERNSTRSAQGTVYWVKYWDKDLGVGECKQLVSWPREKMTAAIAAIKGTTTNSTSTDPKLYLTNLNASNLITVTNDTFPTASGNSTGLVQTGWNSSNSKAICNNRIFQGLPITLQAIIGKPTIGFHNYTSMVNSETGQSDYDLSVLDYAPNSFVYVSSISSINTEYISRYEQESLYELTGSTEPIAAGQPTLTPYTWINTAPAVINAQTYMGSGAENKWVSSSTTQSYWLNIRFKDYPITWSASNQLNIYEIDATKLGSETFYNAIGVNNIRTGDVVIYTSQNGSILEGVYMYINQNDLLSYGMQTMTQSGVYATGSSSNVVGGWIKSTPYVTRSVTNTGNRYPNYIYITEEGRTIAPSASNDQAASGSLNLNFAFTV